jgi:hypothetical protein
MLDMCARFGGFLHPSDLCVSCCFYASMSEATMMIGRFCQTPTSRPMRSAGAAPSDSLFRSPHASCHVYMKVCLCVYIYIYTYIYIHTPTMMYCITYSSVIFYSYLHVYVCVVEAVLILRF